MLPALQLTSWTPRRIACAVLIISTFLIVLYRSSLSTPFILSYNYPPGRDTKEDAHEPALALPPPPPLNLPHLSTAPSPSDLWNTFVPSLQRLLAQKVLSHQDSLERESRRCPSTYLQANQDQLRRSQADWARMSGEFLRGKRREVADRVLQRLGFELESKGMSLKGQEWEELYGKGRGMVFTAGNKDTASRLLTALRILRNRHGCTLPAEVWGFPQEIRTLGAVRESLEALGGVTFREINSKAKGGLWKQFQIKGEAIARSSFSEILYLDSDNVPLRDPTYLFDSPVYAERGVVLWPDFAKDAAFNPIYRTLNTPCDPLEWQIESGQVLINKLGQGGLNFVALLVAEAMQADFEFWFKLSEGDKDTFRYAFYFLNLPYTRVPHYLSSAGSMVPSYKGGHSFCGHTMLQYGLSPDEWAPLQRAGLVDSRYETPDHAPPLFVHANLLKHSVYSNWDLWNWRGWFVSKGNYNKPGDTFKTIKYALPDTVASSSFTSDLSYKLRFTVMGHRGLCVDIWDSEGEAGNSTRMSGVDGAYETGRVKVTNWEEAWGGILKGFEKMYYDDSEPGGQAAGW